MEEIINGSQDLHENPEYSIQQTHSLETENVLPVHNHIMEENDTGGAEGKELMWNSLEREQTIIIIFQTILLVLLCVLGTLANSLVFWIFNRRPALRSLSNRFVLSLVTANLLISSIISPLLLFESILKDALLLPCVPEVISTISSSGIFSAIFSTFLIAMDRFYAVTSPLHYSMVITRSRSQMMIFMAWLSGILLSIPYLIICALPTNSQLQQNAHLSFTILQLALVYFFPFLALCWLYLRMYHAAHRNSERTRKHSISGELLTVMDGTTSMIPPQGIEFLTHYMNPFSKPMVGSVMGHCNNQSQSMGHVVPLPVVKKQRRRSSNGSSSSLLFREEGRAIKTAFFVLASFLLCWTPHFASILLNEIDSTINNKMDVEGMNLTVSMSMPNPVKTIHHHGESDWARFFGVFGILLSCLLNPFIYVFRNKMACKEVTKLLCTVFREKKMFAKQDAEARERHQQQLLTYRKSQDKGDETEGANYNNERNINGNGIIRNNDDDIDVNEILDYPKFTPCIGKSPKRSSLKSLTPQSSLNSTTTNCNSITNANSPGSESVVPSKPPFLRSLTLPEQSQPRVKFPPNLIRQKSCIHRPAITELTPALSKRSRFVRQDSFCSILSTDSVLMICAEDGSGLCVSENGLLNNRSSGGERERLAAASSSATNSTTDNNAPNCRCNSHGPLSFQKQYLRQDSNCSSNASEKTHDSGIVVSAKNSASASPCIVKSSESGPSGERRQSSSHRHYPIMQTTI